MIILGYILIFLGSIAAIISEFILLAIAFKRSLLWFIGCLVFPVLLLAFFILNPKKTGKPLVALVLGASIAWLGFRLAGIESYHIELYHR